MIKCGCFAPDFPFDRNHTIEAYSQVPNDSYSSCDAETVKQEKGTRFAPFGSILPLLWCRIIYIAFASYVKPFSRPCLCDRGSQHPTVLLKHCSLLLSFFMAFLLSFLSLSLSVSFSLTVHPNLFVNDVVANRTVSLELRRPRLSK